MKKKIVIAVADFSQEQVQCIGATVKDWAAIVPLAQDADEQDYREVLRDAFACIGWPKPEWVMPSSLELLQIGSSGWDAYQGRGLEAKKDFVLCSARGIYTIGVAEHAIAMMFALTRRLPVHVHDKDNRRFMRHLPYAPELTGATACIVGLGAIGKAIAQRCKGIGMQVYAVVRDGAAGKDTASGQDIATGQNAPSGLDTASLQDVSSGQHPASGSNATVDRLFPPDRLKEAVSAAGHVFAAVPGNMENDKLFSRDVFLSFRPGAFFYNISRGTVADEDALYEMLAAGKLGGAGLDVTCVEPLPPHDRLWTLGDQVLITGHSAGLSAGHTERFCQLAIRNLNNYRSGRPLENRMI